MTALQDKHVILQKLRQRFSPLGVVRAALPFSRSQPGNRPDPLLLPSGFHEMIGETSTDFAAALAFALGMARQHGLAGRALFFASLTSASQERGQLYGAGAGCFGLDPSRMLLFEAPSEKALLWAAEEAVGCPALGAAVIALGHREKLYGFTASRRLKLRQTASGVPFFLVRSMTGEATAATARWRVSFAPSEEGKAPGAPMPLLGPPRFRVVLERYAGLPPQEWMVEFDETHRLRVAAPVSDRPADAHPIRAGAA